jgi:lysophospholipase L1-like esterase
VLTRPHTGGTFGSVLLRWVPNGTTLNVACQVNNGDQEDGRTQYGHPFTTWDRLTDGTYVYDWYMTTPLVGTDGYSPGMPHCAQPADNSKPYVALGDSYSAGLGSYNYAGYPSDGCNRSPETYSVLAAKAGLPSWVGTNSATLLACNGALVSSMYTAFKGISTGQLYTGDLGPKTRLVTITIGGNDVDFVTALKDCIPQLAYGPGSPSDVCWQQQISRMTAIINGDLQSRLVTLYKAIQQLAPSAVIIVVTYPDIFPSTNNGPQCSLGLGALGAMTQDDLNHVHGTWLLLNEKIAAAAAQAGVWYMDESARFSGRDICQLPANRDANNIMYKGADMTLAQGQAGDPQDFESYHPTYAGYQLMAADLLFFIHTHFSP